MGWEEVTQSVLVHDRAVNTTTRVTDGSDPDSRTRRAVARATVFV